MLSRPCKAAAESLTALLPPVASKRNPMKVNKPKRNRVNRVKQGRKPKLSASQKRKLVRLYVFTNLSLRAISHSILRFGQGDIKIRALQYLLKGYFGAHYNQLRPKDENEMRRRLRQIQRCRQSMFAEHHGLGKAETLSEPVVFDPLQTTVRTVDNSCKNPINASKLPASPPSVIVAAEDEPYFQWFDFSAFSDNYGYNELERTNGDQNLWQIPYTNATDPLDPTLSPSSFPMSTTGDAPVPYPNALDQTNSSTLEGLLESELFVASGPSILEANSDKNTLKTGLCSPGQLRNPPELEKEVAGVQRAESITTGTGPLLGPCIDGTKIEATTSLASQTLTPTDGSEAHTLIKTQAGPPTFTGAVQTSQASSEEISTSVLEEFSNLTLSDRDFLENSSDSGASESSRFKTCGESSTSAQETYLMERIRFSASDDKEIEELIRAETEVEARNTSGETALHVSVQLGKKNATKALLHRGANVHAKNKMGQSVLTAALKAQRRAKEDDCFYARIAECIALSMDAGVVAAPVLHQELHPTVFRDRPRRKEMDERYYR